MADNDIECRFCSLAIFQGIKTSIAKGPYIFMIFQVGGGGGSGPPVHPLDPRMHLHDPLFANPKGYPYTFELNWPSWFQKKYILMAIK